jgi:RNA-directed DNA polymerase
MKHDLTLTQNLMERICERDNLRRAYKQVVSNRGAAGVDRMTIDELFAWAQKNIEALRESLLNGIYQPQVIRGVSIPKPSGGLRTLGIPTVVDRLVQQAILQILQPIYDPEFSDHSYGFRPTRSTHQALLKARSYVDAGFDKVVDMDLEKFFDKVNHDILMSRLARRIGDKRLLLLIRRFLTAGMMENGVTSLSRSQGMPQGSPLSPLLSNILLDDLDKELERRGHRFVRFADDCNVYVKSQEAAERVLKSLTGWLARQLRLTVNATKSAADSVRNRKFLGYRISVGQFRIAPESIDRLKVKLRKLSARRSPQSLEDRVEKLNQVIRGWVNYFKLADARIKLLQLDQWLRRRIRCLRLHQLKRTFPRVAFLKSQGVSSKVAWMTMLSGKGLWRLANTPAVSMAMNLKWFEDLGLLSLEMQYLKLKEV